MKKSHKTALLSFLAILVAVGVWQGVRKYPDVKADILEQSRRKEIYVMSGVDRADGFHAKMDTLMAFVHNNSQHNIDEEYLSDLRNKPRSLDKMIAYAKGEREERPHMACAARSKLLLPLAQRAGFEAHMVDLFKYKADYNSHVVLEVKNPETGLWEVYDPTYQIYWKNNKTGARASMRDLVFTPDFPFTPCHDEKRCGYSRADHDWPAVPDLPEFFGMAVLIDGEREGAVMLNNEERFDLESKPPGGDKLFCDWGGKRWCPKARETGVSAAP